MASRKRQPQRVKCFVVINMPHPGVFPEVMMTKPTQILKSAYMLFFQIPRLPESIMSFRDYSTMEQALKVTSRKETFSGKELGAYNIAWSRHNALKSMLNWYRAIPHSIRSIAKKSKVDVSVKIIWAAQINSFRSVWQRRASSIPMLRQLYGWMVLRIGPTRSTLISSMSRYWNFWMNISKESNRLS
ncbi:hypothetical protein [Salinicoccus sp. CNSTN-B1]